MTTDEKAKAILADLARRVSNGEHWALRPDWDFGTMTIEFLGRDAVLFADTNEVVPEDAMDRLLVSSEGPSTIDGRAIVERFVAHGAHNHVGGCAGKLEDLIDSMYMLFIEGAGLSFA